MKQGCGLRALPRRRGTGVPRLRGQGAASAGATDGHCAMALFLVRLGSPRPRAAQIRTRKETPMPPDNANANDRDAYESAATTRIIGNRGGSGDRRESIWSVGEPWRWLPPRRLPLLPPRLPGAPGRRRNAHRRDEGPARRRNGRQAPRDAGVGGRRQRRRALRQVALRRRRPPGRHPRHPRRVSLNPQAPALRLSAIPAKAGMTPPPSPYKGRGRRERGGRGYCGWGATRPRLLNPPAPRHSRVGGNLASSPTETERGNAI